MLKRNVGLSLLLLCLALPAQAHHVWAEWTGGPEAKAYFGEWEDDVRENNDFLSKYAVDPQSISATAAPKPAVLREGFFSFPVAPGGDARLTAAYVTDKGAASMFHARAGRSDTRAVLPLEIVPVTAGGNSFRLLLDGQPVPKAKVTVIGPPRWTKQFTTDAEGVIAIQTPWPGQYVLEAIVSSDDKSGSWSGKAYTRLRHVSTLSFVVP